MFPVNPASSLPTCLTGFLACCPTGWRMEKSELEFSKNLFFVGVGFCSFQTCSSYLIEWWRDWGDGDRAKYVDRRMGR